MCMDYKVDGYNPTSRPKGTWNEVFEEDMRHWEVKKEDAVVCSTGKWRRLISVRSFLVPAHLECPGKRPVMIVWDKTFDRF